MRKFIFTLTLVFGLSLNVWAQGGNNILGLYLVEGGRGKVQIGREGNKYVGTLVWTIENGALDTKNPETKIIQEKNP